MKKPLLIIRIGPTSLPKEQMDVIVNNFSDLKEDFYVVVYNQVGVDSKITLVSDESIKSQEV